MTIDRKPAVVWFEEGVGERLGFPSDKAHFEHVDRYDSGCIYCKVGDERYWFSPLSWVGIKSLQSYNETPKLEEPATIGVTGP